MLLFINGKQSPSTTKKRLLAEDELFLHKSGAFRFLCPHWLCYNGNSRFRKIIHTLCIRTLKPQNRNLFIQQLSTINDIETAHQKLEKQCFWLPAPNANLYIENKLPKPAFLEQHRQLFVLAPTV